MNWKDQQAPAKFLGKLEVPKEIDVGSGSGSRPAQANKEIAKLKLWVKPDVAGDVEGDGEGYLKAGLSELWTPQEWARQFVFS